MSACEAFSADHSADKSARDSVYSKGLYERLRFPLMGFFYHEVDLANGVIALVSKVAFCVRPCIVMGQWRQNGHFAKKF